MHEYLKKKPMKNEKKNPKENIFIRRYQGLWNFTLILN